MKSLLFCIVFLCTFNVNAQEILRVSQEPVFTQRIETTFFNAAEELYQVNLVSKSYKRFSCLINFRMEDELTSDSTYSLLNEVTFFDFKLNYELGAFGLNMIINNLLSFNDPNFAIEPIRDSNIIGDVYFSHEANFLVSTCITYNF